MPKMHIVRKSRHLGQTSLSDKACAKSNHCVNNNRIKAYLFVNASLAWSHLVLMVALSFVRVVMTISHRNQQHKRHRVLEPVVVVWKTLTACSMKFVVILLSMVPNMFVYQNLRLMTCERMICSVLNRIKIWNVTVALPNSANVKRVTKKDCRSWSTSQCMIVEKPSDEFVNHVIQHVQIHVLTLSSIIWILRFSLISLRHCW